MAKPYRVEPIWLGETAVIVGCGPSVTFDQIRHIAQARLEERCRVVAINDACYWCWWADWLHGGDAKWWTWRRTTAQKFPGIRTTVCETVPHQWIDGHLKATGIEGFDPDPSCVRSGRNSAYQAVCAMVHAGVSRILLVGVDACFGPAGQTHCHGGHPDRGAPEDPETDLGGVFETLLPTLRERGVEVMNCSPVSAVQCFEKRPIEEVL